MDEEELKTVEEMVLQEIAVENHGLILSGSLPIL